MDALDTQEQSPAASPVDDFALGKQTPHDRRSVRAQQRKIVAGERRGGADDVAPKPDRRRVLEREPVVLTTSSRSTLRYSSSLT
jgi:hypothetical protein